MLRRLVRQPATLAAGGFIGLVVLVAVLAPVLAPYDPIDQELRRTLEGPSGDHWLGTDYLGRDTLSRLMFGARVALQASLQTVAIALLIGVPLGLLAGYRSGWWDRILMRLLDVADAIPGLVLAFGIIAVLGSGLSSAMIAVSVIFAMNYMRLSRALALAEREKLYVDAATVSGLTQRNLVFRQMLPNMASPLIVQSTIYMGTALLIEAALSYLGLGLDLGQPSWGGMLNGATRWQSEQPFLPWPPGLAITLTVLAYNLLGDGLRDALAGERSIRSGWARRRARATAAAASATADRSPAGENVPRDRGTPPALEIDQLSIAFPLDGRMVTVVDRVSLTVQRGQTLGIVGESGSGKTMTGLAALGLVPTPGTITGGTVRVEGRDISGLSDPELTQIRGNQIAMVFQDPLVALSPVHTVGRQLIQAVRNHDRGLSRKAAVERAADLLGLVGIVDAQARLRDYPHQFSGGMAQRVVIALALAGNPGVLVADEPTTALDVTTQLQVLDLLAGLKDRLGMALVLITHDLGIVADSCDNAVVMYAGEAVEHGSVDDLFARPRHPYTSALLAAVPTNAAAGRLPTITGRVPPMQDLPPGCRFAPRCAHRKAACLEGAIELVAGSRCLRAEEVALPGANPGGPVEATR